VSSSRTGTKFLVGVFDGHGENGRRISELARTSITRTFLAHKELHFDPTAALETAFLETQDLIERRHHTAAQHSGTTAVIPVQFLAVQMGVARVQCCPECAFGPTGQCLGTAPCLLDCDRQRLSGRRRI